MKKDVATKENIIDTLKEIKQSIVNDVGSAINLYLKHYFEKNEGIGLFAVPRMIFPEVDNLGSYYSGITYNNAENAIKFIKEYFSRVNGEYKKKGAFIYLIYRHGLMHQHTPKLMSYKRKVVGWHISLRNHEVISNHLKLDGKAVIIDGVQLYKDILDAIDFYISDIERGNKKLFNNFIKAHKAMMKPDAKTNYLGRNYITQRDFNFLK